MNHRFFALAAAAISASLAGPSAAAVSDPYVAFVPIDSHPAIPAGLKVACFPIPTVLAMSKTCPVIRYKGNTTWAYSFIDNRVSMALVTYDAHNNVVGNLTKNGARYVWDVHSGKVPMVEFFGQSNQMVVASWDELKPAVSH